MWVVLTHKKLFTATRDLRDRSRSCGGHTKSSWTQLFPIRKVCSSSAKPPFQVALRPCFSTNSKWNTMTLHDIQGSHLFSYQWHGHWHTYWGASQHQSEAFRLYTSFTINLKEECWNIQGQLWFIFLFGMQVCSTNLPLGLALPLQ